ncbi:hypothetical protein Sbal625DRAFT_2675 [Shewanella baltica OS625]|nr:hypothetical protein Sbal678_0637 [Shewanella baltica OS678]AEG09978.1 hypothetical protein Sbal175_0692 [Shewanella baltica BA175]EHC06084.1 hypothetical protein Sbal625DRAFT_2675 [Shewanella baltica OS625]
MYLKIYYKEAKKQFMLGENQNMRKNAKHQFND